jgi:hypothetical protein
VEEPIRTKVRIDILEAQCAKFKIDKAEPILQKDRRLRELPKADLFMTDIEVPKFAPRLAALRADPRRTKLRTETAEPMWAKSKMETHDPTLAKLRSETLEPRWLWSRTLKLPPNSVV